MPAVSFQLLRIVCKSAMCGRQRLASLPSPRFSSNASRSQQSMLVLRAFILHPNMSGMYKTVRKIRLSLGSWAQNSKSAMDVWGVRSPKCLKWLVDYDCGSYHNMLCNGVSRSFLYTYLSRRGETFNDQMKKIKIETVGTLYPCCCFHLWK